MTENEKLELEFLRYFYDIAGAAMGPADLDIYDKIKANFKKSYGYLPVGYFEEDEEE